MTSKFRIEKRNNLPIWQCCLVLVLLMAICLPAQAVQAQSPLTLNPNWGSQMYLNEAWSATLTASGGTGAYNYSIVSGNIPGLSLVSGAVSATYSGTPNAEGTYTIEVRVTDSASPTPNTVSATHTYIVARHLQFNPADWGAQIYAGKDWSATFNAAQGVSPYSYALTSGNIPGLSLTSGGVSALFSGTPSTVGTYEIAIRASDSAVGGGESVTAQHTYSVISATNLEIQDFASSHPRGEYRAGYTLWVQVNLNANSSLPASPALQVQISSNNGGPACLSSLDADGTGECALLFSSAGDYLLTANFPGSTYFEASGTTLTLQILANDRTKTLSAGRNHSCLLDELGNASCWGLEDSYTIKNAGGTILSSVSDGSYSQISAGGYHTCAIDGSGAIHCWGDATEITDASQIPNSVGGKTLHYIYVDAGDDHVCAIDSKFRLHCWGEIIPEILAGIPNTPVTAISVGETNDCAISRSNNRVSCWGLNTNGQLAVPANLEASRLDVGTTHTCAIRKSDSHVLCWGTPAMTPPSAAFKEIESGSNYSCGLSSTNQIQCWGTNTIVSSTPAGTFTNLSMGAFHGCALQPGSSAPYLKCWGSDAYGRAPSLSLAPSALPAYLQLSLPWAQTFTAGGGSAPYSLSSGAGLPGGLTLTDFNLSGTPNTTGSFTFTLSLNESFPAANETHPLQLAPAVKSHTIIVKNPQTTIQILSNDSNISMGSAVNVSVRVNKSGGSGAPVIGGTVTISGHEAVSGRSSQCTGSVTETGGYGYASCSIYFGEAGTQNITAVYNGDTFYLAGSNTAASSTEITPIIIDPMISAGSKFNCSISGSGSPYCWGDNNSGQTIPADYIFKQISAGDSQVCAVGVNSQIFCWGWNGYGLVTGRPSGYGYLAVSAGETHTCALNSDGSIQCWGNNANGQTSVPSRTDFAQLDAGGNHTCALTSAGAPYCWGLNSSGQSDLPSSTILKAISAGGAATCGLNSSDEIQCWGGTSEFRANIPAGKYLSISVGSAHACALDQNHQIQCWGAYPQEIPGSFSAVSAGKDHNCALTSPDGYLKCWGSNALGQAPVITINPGSLPVLSTGTYWSSQVTGSGARTSALSFIHSGDLPAGLTFTSSGSIFGTPTLGNEFTYSIRAIESNLSPALVQDIAYTQRVKGGTIVSISSVTPEERMAGKALTISVQVTAAANNLFTQYAGGTIQLEVNGQVICTATLQNGSASCTVFFSSPGEKSIIARYAGDERFLPANTESDPAIIAVLPYEQDLGLVSGESETYIHKSDGSLICLGANCKTAIFNGLYTAFGVGNDFTCALLMDGSLKCLTGSTVITEVGPFSDLSVGKDHVCALQLDGHVLCRGSNDQGQASPPAETFSKIVSGNGAACGLLRSNGHALCWGNLAAEAVPDAAFSSLTVGNGHACGLSAGGQIQCWGSAVYGQTSPPAGSGFQRISSGDFHTCALDDSGLIQCWGANDAGQSGAPYGSYSVLDSYGNHACALRSADQITCWGGNEHGEAVHIQVAPFASLETPALHYWEHFYMPEGGQRPYSAEIVSGSLPVGLALETDTVISPSGWVVYGTPTNPARYHFVVRWTDANLPHRVVDLPYELTVTGADLAVEINGAHADTALKSNIFYFDYIFRNNTPLDIPEVSIQIALPESGFEDIVLSGMPECTLDGIQVTCPIAALPASSVHNLRISGLVTGEVGTELVSTALIQPTLANWPEVQPLNNSARAAVQVSYQSLILSDDFDSGPGEDWEGGHLLTAPGGQSLLESDYPHSQSIRLLIDPVAPHKKLKVSFDLYVLGDWQGNGEEGISLPAIFSFGASGLSPKIRTSFCNLASCTQSFHAGLLYTNFPPFYRAESIGSLGYDPEILPEAKYHIELSFAHEEDSIDLTWLAENLPAEARFALDNVEIQLDSGWCWVYLPNIIQ